AVEQRLLPNLLAIRGVETQRLQRVLAIRAAAIRIAERCATHDVRRNGLVRNRLADDVGGEKDAIAPHHRRRMPLARYRRLPRHIAIRRPRRRQILQRRNAVSRRASPAGPIVRAAKNREQEQENRNESHLLFITSTLDGMAADRPEIELKD